MNLASSEIQISLDIIFFAVHTEMHWVISHIYLRENDQTLRTHRLISKSSLCEFLIRSVLLFRSSNKII